jgi:putative tricarboxylic transport membrane protein
MLRSALMVVIGIMLGTVGIDPMTGVQRFTFGSTELMNGIPFHHRRDGRLRACRGA